MPEQKGPIQPYDGNFLQLFGERIRLVLRLMADSRVSFLLKLLPIGSLLYLISPIDLGPDVVPPWVLDDAGVLLLANYMFVEMCPPELVEEHIAKLRKQPGQGSFPGSLRDDLPRPPANDADVVDADFTEVPPKEE